jgi:hypothetical protein
MDQESKKGLEKTGSLVKDIKGKQAYKKGKKDRQHPGCPEKYEKKTAG